MGVLKTIFGRDVRACVNVRVCTGICLARRCEAPVPCVGRRVSICRQTTKLSVQRGFATAGWFV